MQLNPFKLAEEASNRRFDNRSKIKKPDSKKVFSGSSAKHTVVLKIFEKSNYQVSDFVNASKHNPDMFLKQSLR